MSRPSVTPPPGHTAQLGNLDPILRAIVTQHGLGAVRAPAGASEAVRAVLVSVSMDLNALSAYGQTLGDIDNGNIDFGDGDQEGWIRDLLTKAITQ